MLFLRIKSELRPLIDNRAAPSGSAMPDVPPEEAPFYTFYIVSLRPENAPPGLGRASTLRALVAGLPGIGCAPVWLQIAAPKSKIVGVGRAFFQALRAAANGRLLPLQSFLALQGTVPQQEAPVDPRCIVYVDGVRLAHLGPRLLAGYGGRLIVDFDDLMSRRVARMQRRKEPLAFGAFTSLVPPPLLRLVQILGPLQFILYAIEKKLLRAAEIRAAGDADAIAFASAFEARLFARFLRRYRPAIQPRCLVLGPCIEPRQLPSEVRLRPPPEQLRFIFLGSDILQQNRVAIEGILELAAENRLALPVHVYGHMTREYETPPGVKFEGFVKSLDDVYQTGSILLIPRSLRGGIKTKILEAFAHGVPSVATPSALEGFSRGYPWQCDGEPLQELVGNRSALSSGYQDAVASGLEICSRSFSARRHWDVLRNFLHDRGRESTGRVLLAHESAADEAP